MNFIKKITLFLLFKTDIVMCLNFGTPKIINFPFGTNGKLHILEVPIIRQITVSLNVYPVLKNVYFASRLFICAKYIVFNPCYKKTDHLAYGHV